ncbi:MAG: phage terminase large subunit family protein [Methylophilaceae bacterium]
MGAIDSKVFDGLALAKSFSLGMKTFGVPEPMTLDQWAAEHFYLSAESSYVEQKWEAWPFQRAIMSCISNDDIEEINWRKSARVGYTKILLASIGYFAEHKRRNQALWQPTDDDRDEFVKTELDPMLRDVKVMQSVMTSLASRNKDNTLQQKKLKGSMIHLRGGKAAKNYRRISVDNAYVDEHDAFDSNIEKEGDAGDLAVKRIEGATFPKAVFGTTPKLLGFSNIQKRERNADVFLTYRIPCPSCNTYHAISWGGKGEGIGFKWTNDNPESVRHLCPHCGVLITQAEYLSVCELGRFEDDNGITLSNDGDFFDAQGNPMRAPRHVAFHVWSAYSPNVSWASVVREFLAAHAEMMEGKSEKMQTFTNTTRGEYWAQNIESTDSEELKQRGETFALERIPMGCLLLLAGVDTQDNRLECVVWGYGRGCEKWTIADRVFFGNPAQDAVWLELEQFLFETEFQHASGSTMQISATAIDSRGHHTQDVYAFAEKHTARKVFAVAGRSGREKHIKDGATKVDIDWRGKTKKQGLTLWWVGTNLAKDLIYNRMQLTQPGAGYMHFSHELSDEFFKQMSGEDRTTRRSSRGYDESAWVAKRKRVEKWDCTVYAVWLEHHFDLAKKTERFWTDLENRFQPAVTDLFSVLPVTNKQEQVVVEKPAAPKAAARSAPKQSNQFASQEWMERR